MRMKISLILFVFILSLTPAFAASDAIPRAIHYQGQLRERDIRDEGDGIFRFALVDDTTPTPKILWSNDGTQLGKTANNVPSKGVELTVTKGLFNVALGDESLTNMTQIPVTLFRDNKIVLEEVQQTITWGDDVRHSQVERLVLVDAACAPWIPVRSHKICWQWHGSKKNFILIGSDIHKRYEIP